MSAAIIEMNTPHASQNEVNANKKRFNVLNCGRRWGKNEYGVFKVLGKMLKPNNYVGWYEPTYDSSSIQWDDFVTMFEPLTMRKNEQSRKLYLRNGSRLDFWSLGRSYNVSRGRKYHSCLLYTSPSPRDQRGSRMPSSA